MLYHIGIFVVHSDADINSRDHSGKKPRQVAREGLTIEAQGKKKKSKRRDLSLPWCMCIKKFTMQNGKIQIWIFSELVSLICSKGQPDFFPILISLSLCLFVVKKGAPTKFQPVACFTQSRNRYDPPVSSTSFPRSRGRVRVRVVRESTLITKIVCYPLMCCLNSCSLDSFLFTSVLFLL